MIKILIFDSKMRVQMQIVFVFALLCFYLITEALSQEWHDKNWVFKSYSRDAMILKFDHDSLRFDIQETDIGLYATNTSMSDTDGNLLFYSNGCEIRNSIHHVIKDGNGINTGDIRNDNCSQGGGYLAGYQTMLSIPNPGNPNQYYIFHVSLIYVYEPILDIRSKYLYYTLIDFNDVNGEVVKLIKKDTNTGSMLAKNLILLQDTSIHTGDLTAIKHVNNRFWWIISSKYNSNTYLRFLVNDTTILGPYYQSIGGQFNPDGEICGSICFSPNGKKFVRYNTKDGLYVYDFDRETGLLSNFKNVILNEPERIGGVSVSPNSRFVYASSYKKLFQFDLEASDLSNSKILIDTFNWVASPIPPFYDFFSMSQLGPDCRIYITSYNSTDRISVIKHPDLPGKACEFVQHGLVLPSSHGGSLPHFPNYRLGTGPVCDSTIDFISRIEHPVGTIFTNIFPNPTRDQIQLELEICNESKVNFIIQDLNSKQVFKANINSSQTKYTFDIRGVPSGVYIYFIYTDERIFDSGKLIKLE